MKTCWNDLGYEPLRTWALLPSSVRPSGLAQYSPTEERYELGIGPRHTFPGEKQMANPNPFSVEVY